MCGPGARPWDDAAPCEDMFIPPHDGRSSHVKYVSQLNLSIVPSLRCRVGHVIRVLTSRGNKRREAPAESSDLYGNLHNKISLNPVELLCVEPDSFVRV